LPGEAVVGEIVSFEEGAGVVGIPARAGVTVVLFLTGGEKGEKKEEFR
jgi:hypothetical protein